MVTLRKATMDDIDLIYKWANDPIVRSNSFNQEPILYDDHKKWFERIMAGESTLQYILMEEKIPIGQIRLDIYGSEAEISYSISADHRGCGYGRMILRLLMQEVREQLPEISRLVAKVKPDNYASKSVFEKENFKTEYTCYSFDVI